MAEQELKAGKGSGGLQVLLFAEAQVVSLGKTFDAAALENLRTVVDANAGGSPADEVVASLANLLDNLIASGRFDREALAVHVRAWRLMLTAEPDPGDRAALMTGLHAIGALYAEREAA